MKETDISLLPVRFFRLFLDVLNAEAGRDTLKLVLEKSNLPANLVDPQVASRYNGTTSAVTYARIQKAMRMYYGRGARGALTRIGRQLWPRLLESASLPEKAQAQIVRTLPPSMRLKPTLELLARFIQEHNGSVTIHTLDLDLMLVDHASSAAVEQAEAHNLCYVTLGLIQQALFWASGREYDVEETSCRACGGGACEFKISVSKNRK